MINDFTEMPVWQKAMDVAEKCFNISENLPRKEDYALTSQLRRSAESISANIAEGCGRGTDADFARFLQIAMGSASELEYHLLLARDLGFLNCLQHEKLNSQVTEVKRMLVSFIQKLKAES